MINFTIKNFKCFYKTSVNINKLTVLAGANGYGKSSIIQALLFLRRTIEHCAKWDGQNYTQDIDTNLSVELNGAYCLSLGMSNDIIPMNADMQSRLTLQLESDKEKLSIAYDLSDEKAFLWLNFANDGIKIEGDVIKLPIFKQVFYYLNAERIGPRVAQKVKFHDYPNVGCQGEFTAQILAEYGNKTAEKNHIIEVDKSRILSLSDTNNSLIGQTQAWMQYLMPEVSVYSRIDDKMQRAQIIVENSYTKGSPVIATNIGFGISYVLPIIVTGLIAKPNAFMIIENPEAHLHPSAQSKIGEFLAIIAASGVNVIVETHSDHVINGIQIATAKGKISKDSITINYLNKTSDVSGRNTQPEVSELTINEKGELSHWPKGFFDQTQIDFVELLRLRRQYEK